MTAAETLAYAQTSVDQIERGLGFVQEQLDRAEDIALRVDELSVTASEVVVKARRASRIAFIAAGLLAIGGIVAFVVVRRRKEPETAEPTDQAADA